MNYTTALVLAALLIVTPPSFAAAKTKEVCKISVEKNGSTTKKCKKVKVHKKLNGTKVPGKK